MRQFCGECGAPLTSGARFCRECGAPVEVPRCPACGEAVPADAVFCGNCGQDLRQRPVPPEPEPEPAPEPIPEPEPEPESPVIPELPPEPALQPDPEPMPEPAPRPVPPTPPAPKSPKAKKPRSGKRTAVVIVIVVLVLAALAAAFTEVYLRRMLPEKALAHREATEEIAELVEDALWARNLSGRADAVLAHAQRAKTLPEFRDGEFYYDEILCTYNVTVTVNGTDTTGTVTALASFSTELSPEADDLRLTDEEYDEALTALLESTVEAPSEVPSDNEETTTGGTAMPEGVDTILKLSGTYYALTDDDAVELELNVTGEAPYARLRYRLSGGDPIWLEYGPNGGDLLYLEDLGDNRWQSEITATDGTAGTLTLTCNERSEVFVAVNAGRQSLSETQVENAENWLDGAYVHYTPSQSWHYTYGDGKDQSFTPPECEQFLRQYFYGSWYAADGTELTFRSGETLIYGLSGYGDHEFLVNFLIPGVTQLQLADFSLSNPDVLTINDAAYYRDPEDAVQSDFLLPVSNSRYLTEEDLEDLSWEECCLARNEIYARHGRIFTTPEIVAYFESKDWYEGTVPGTQFDAISNDLFNEYERANIRFISDYEQEHFGGSYY